MEENREITYCIGNNHWTPIYCKLGNAKNFLIVGDTALTDATWYNFMASLVILNENVKVYDWSGWCYDKEIASKITEITGTIAERLDYLDNLVMARSNSSADKLQHIFIMLRCPFESELNSIRLFDIIKKSDPLCHFILKPEGFSYRIEEFSAFRIDIFTTLLEGLNILFDVKVLHHSVDVRQYLRLICLNQDELNYLSSCRNILMISGERKSLRVRTISRWLYNSYGEYIDFILSEKDKVITMSNKELRSAFLIELPDEQAKDAFLFEKKEGKLQKCRWQDGVGLADDVCHKYLIADMNADFYWGSDSDIRPLGKFTGKFRIMGVGAISLADYIRIYEVVRTAEYKKLPFYVVKADYQIIKLLQKDGYTILHRPYFAMKDSSHALLTVTPSAQTVVDAGEVKKENISVEDFLALYRAAFA